MPATALFKEANYGDGYIDSLSDYIQRQFPGIKGFNRRGLYHMKQFYETYAGNEKMSALLTQLSWYDNFLFLVNAYDSDPFSAGRSMNRPTCSMILTVMYFTFLRTIILLLYI